MQVLDCLSDNKTCKNRFKNDRFSIIGIVDIASDMFNCFYSPFKFPLPSFKTHIKLILKKKKLNNINILNLKYYIFHTVNYFDA